MSSQDVAGTKDTHVCVNTDTFDKYKPGKVRFYIQDLAGTKEKTNKFETSDADTSNLLNKDVGALNIKPVKSGSVIEMDFPKELARNFAVKFVPKGTRFIMSFDHGDSSRPRLIGRDFSDEQGGYAANPEEGEQNRFEKCTSAAQVN